MENYKDRIRHCKHCPYSSIIEDITIEYLGSIIKMMKSLGLKNEEFYEIDQRNARLRGLSCKYSDKRLLRVGYFETLKKHNLHGANSGEYQGNHYVIQVWYEEYVYGLGVMQNCDFIGMDYCHIEYLQAFYDYFRLEKEKIKRDKKKIKKQNITL